MTERQPITSEVVISDYKGQAFEYTSDFTIRPFNTNNCIKANTTMLVLQKCANTSSIWGTFEHTGQLMATDRTGLHSPASDRKCLTLKVGRLSLGHCRGATSIKQQFSFEYWNPHQVRTLSAAAIMALSAQQPLDGKQLPSIPPLLKREEKLNNETRKPTTKLTSTNIKTTLATTTKPTTTSTKPTSTTTKLSTTKSTIPTTKPTTTTAKQTTTTRPTTTTTRATATTRPTTTTTRATTTTTKSTSTTRPTSTTTSKPIKTPKSETPKTTTTSTTTTTIQTTTTAATTIQSTSKTSEEIIQINQNPTEEIGFEIIEDNEHPIQQEKPEAHP
ncbi:hypothetical protein GHT06_008770 [Daphnia sinensis]|uniref:Uncharacterized protein n=1 Tax=Daphnia sinensis TaxID=1820382 RepID=A0AAD5L4W8_9CRUS|nr:hypothetical protein GHT06_008770 [Daphnia sinensis]